jgi:hypothetical protein
MPSSRAWPSLVTITAAAWSTTGCATMNSVYGKHSMRLRPPTVSISSTVRGTGSHAASFFAATALNSDSNSADQCCASS